MRIKEFWPRYHLEVLHSMLKARNVEHLPTYESLPRTGCIVYDNETPVAVSFLRKVEGGYGMVDGLTSNPECSSEQRHTALNMAIQYCVKEAERQGISYLISFCADKTTVSRAEYNGFVEQPHRIVTLNLKAKT